jgi:hypothetical protein
MFIFFFNFEADVQVDEKTTTATIASSVTSTEGATNTVPETTPPSASLTSTVISTDASTNTVPGTTSQVNANPSTGTSAHHHHKPRLILLTFAITAFLETSFETAFC